MGFLVLLSRGAGIEQGLIFEVETQGFGKRYAGFYPPDL
jgi:hypothetical protein